MSVGRAMMCPCRHHDRCARPSAHAGVRRAGRDRGNRHRCGSRRASHPMRERGAQARPHRRFRGGRAGAPRGVRREGLQVVGAALATCSAGSASRPAAASWPRSRSRRGSGWTGRCCPRGCRPPPRCSPTGRASLRHVEVIARVLDTPSARAALPRQWAGAERRSPAKATLYTPSELQAWAPRWSRRSIRTAPNPTTGRRASQRAAPDPAARRRKEVKGRIDDAAMFDAIATVIDAKAKPLTADDERSAGQRQAEALADVCGYVLDHADGPGVRRPPAARERGDPARGPGEPGPRRLPRLRRDLSPEALRMLCCDATAVPIVLNGAGQPLDVGRATRTIPDGLRRAVAARDRGCAHPGCGRPISWTECPPHYSVGVRRRDEAGQSGHAVPGAPSADPLHRMDRADT